MTWKQFLTSSLGKKFVMGFTGFFLILFLIIHASINALIFLDDNGSTFNTAAHFMSHNYILRILEVILFIGLILHIIQGLLLWRQNRASRPVKYRHPTKYSKKIKWYSRYMGILGTLLLLYLVMHLSHFWIATKKELYFEGMEVNLFERMREVFTDPLWFTLYMVGLVSLLFHLFQGFQSAFQTFGINHRRWTPIVKGVGYAYSVLICLLFALMPVSFMAGWL